MTYDPSVCLYRPGHTNLDLLAEWQDQTRKYGCPVYEYPFWFWVDASTLEWTMLNVVVGNADVNTAWDRYLAKQGKPETWYIPPYQRDYSGASTAAVYKPPSPAPAPVTTPQAQTKSPATKPEVKSYAWVAWLLVGAAAVAAYYRYTKPR
jgi:hypothetical protein